VLQRCAGNLQDDLVLLPNDKPENEKKLFSRCDEMVFFFFFFNRHCNPSGFWPAQLSLSILSRRGFTEYRCQWHV